MSDLGTLEILGVVMIAFGMFCLVADPLLNWIIGRG